MKLSRTTALALALAVAAPAAHAATITVDETTQHQTIDGFGFFGAHDVWWGSDSDMVDTAWVQLVIDDLGLTIWRNEYYPPAHGTGNQDADWDKQRPVVEAFRDQALNSKVPLSIILSVWSPPANMKCVVENGEVQDGVPHPGGTKDGGALCPSQRDAFADWLIEGVQMYADIGVEVRALSFQNEPLFQQSYNSCYYSQAAYADTLAHIGPRIRSQFSELELFGSENMLAIECGGANGFDPWWYTANIMDRPAALAEMDVWAVHGYSDGVLATPQSEMAQLWTSFYEGTKSTDRPIWMTETSGYVDSWEAGPNGSGETRQGAMDLAQAMYAALVYGNASAWVWWQGSELGNNAPSEFGLMKGTESQGKKYHVSKNFFRFIRPGAQRVAAASDDPEVLVAAFRHPAMESSTVLVINGGFEDKTVSLDGVGLASEYELYRTSATQDCELIGTASTASLTLPARSVNTLVHGSVYEDEIPGGGGAAGGSGSGGSAGAAGNAGSGGSASTGGTAGTAGSSGQSGTGGVGTAGSSGTGPGAAAEPAEEESSGCACRTQPTGGELRLGMLALLGSFAILFGRRRRTKRFAVVASNGLTERRSP